MALSHCASCGLAIARRCGLGLLLLLLSGLWPALAQEAQGHVLFRDFYGTLTRSALDGLSGTELPVRDLPNVPLGNYFQSLDGDRKFAIYRPKSKDLTTLSVHEAGSAKLLFTQDVPAGTFIVGPVFGDPEQYLLRTVVGASDGGQAFVVRLREGRMLGVLSTQGVDDDIAVLPDGRLYRINDKSGDISTAGPDGVWQPLGRLQPPAGMRIGVWRLNHRGDRLAVIYIRSEQRSVIWTDAWVAAIDGSAQQRLTVQGLFNYPLWSPDDREISLRMDTLSSRGPQGRVSGDCGNWRIPADARDVDGLGFGHPHPVAREIFVSEGGKPSKTRACKLAAWVR